MDFLGEEVALSEGLADLALDHLLQSRCDHAEQHGLEGVEEQLVVGLLQLDVHVLDAHVNLVQLEEVLLVVLLSGRGSDLDAETITTEEDIHNTTIGDGGEALLLLDVVGDIAQIHLDARHGNHDLIITLVADLLAAPAEVVVAAELHDVGHQVVTLNAQVLDDHINHGIRDLDTGDGNVADILENAGDDDIAKIPKEIRFEGGLATGILAEILEQLLERLSKGLVLRVLLELVGQELDLVDNTVRVTAVTLAQEVAALIVNLVPLTGAFVLHDEALLAQRFAISGQFLFRGKSSNSHTESSCRRS